MVRGVQNIDCGKGNLVFGFAVRVTKKKEGCSPMGGFAKKLPRRRGKWKRCLRVLSDLVQKGGEVRSDTEEKNACLGTWRATVKSKSPRNQDNAARVAKSTFSNRLKLLFFGFPIREKEDKGNSEYWGRGEEKVPQ